MIAIALESGAPPVASEVSTTLRMGASAAYEVFADAEEIPRWLPMVQTARVLARDAKGRACRVAFTRALDRGSIGYTMDYSYDPDSLGIEWSTPANSNVLLTGEARFVPLSTNACLMVYRLVIDLSMVEGLNRIDGHPASLVVAEFREHVRRYC